MSCAEDEWICRAAVRDAGVHGLKILLILVVGVFVAGLASRLARRSVESLGTRPPLAERSPRAEQRAHTLAGVVSSGVRVVVWSIVGLIIIDELGFNLGPLLAGAGIAGVAIGFGAQSLVKDFVSGFFVLVEDQYGVGDNITIGDTSGTVEEVNLRVTRLRSVDGTVWFIPNGEIRKVGNAAKDWSRALVDVVVPPGTDVSAASAVIAGELAAFAQDAAWSECILEPPEVLGVEDIGSDGATVRVAAKTRPADRARVARELRARIGARLRSEASG